MALKSQLIQVNPAKLLELGRTLMLYLSKRKLVLAMLLSTKELCMLADMMLILLTCLR